MVEEMCLCGQTTKKKIGKKTPFISVICPHFCQQQWQKKASRAEGRVTMVLTRAGKTQGPHR